MLPSSRLKIEASFNEGDTYSVCKNESDLLSLADSCENVSEVLEEKTHRVNRLLSSFCQRRVNDIHSNDLGHKLEMLSLIEYLAAQVSKLQQNFGRLNHHRRRSEQMLLEREELVEKIVRDQKAIQSEKEMLLNKKENLERLHKETTFKLLSERDELQKQLRKMQAHEKAFEVELRKKDKQISIYQESMKKMLAKAQSKTQRFEVNQVFERNSQQNDQISSSKAYGLLSLQKIDETLRSLSQENNHLKQFMSRFIKRLNAVVEAAQHKIKSLPITVNESPRLKVVRLEALELPLKLSQLNLKQILHNLDIIESLINTFELSSTGQQKGSEFEKGPEWKVRNLIQNFKEIIKSQNQILRKTIIDNEQDFSRPDQIEQMNCKMVQNEEFQKIKLMIDEQMEQMQSKNKRLAKTKEKLSSDIKRTERIKQELTKERIVMRGSRH